MFTKRTKKCTLTGFTRRSCGRTERVLRPIAEKQTTYLLSDRFERFAYLVRVFQESYVSLVYGATIVPQDERTSQPERDFSESIKFRSRIPPFRERDLLFFIVSPFSAGLEAERDRRRARAFHTERAADATRPGHLHTRCSG